MKKIARSNYFKILVVLFLCCFCSGCGIKKENQPDLLSSFRINRNENLVVIANRSVIDDKEEFARQLVRMCKENSFKSIKFFTDRGYATSLDMSVYLWRDEVKDQEPVMIVEYKPNEWNQEYGIVNNPEEFRLYVDGELVAYE